MFNPAYIGIVIIGLFHGFEPGHGWPVAVLYSLKKRNAIASAALSSSIIGLGHLVSSVAVVVAYVLLQRWLDFDAPWIKYVAAALVLALAFKLFREKADDEERQHGHNHAGQPKIAHEHEHEHPGQGKHTHKHKHRAAVALSLLGLASFAFVLGFAHEEEIALLALVAGGLNAWVLMVAYGFSVLLGLIVATVAGVKVYARFQGRLSRYEKFIPKIGAGVLVAMAAAIVFW
ncbi:MAG: nickel/cobalt transporter [Chloroflexi bacterium]|nr:nickel/cobalt transporter [Chloroflexota bacterium]